MKVGDRWGRMRCSRIEQDSEEIQFEGGGVERWPVTVYVCACDCGNEVSFKPKEFRKREHRDCGCGLAEDEGGKILMSVTIPDKIRRKLRTWAKENTNGNISVAITEILREFLGEGKEKGNEATVAR